MTQREVHVQESDVLRRMVLTEPDGFSEPIRKLLDAMGYSVSWAKVRGNRLTCFIGGDGVQPVPEVGDRLQKDIGGVVQTGWSPGDRYWEWTWQAPVNL